MLRSLRSALALAALALAAALSPTPASAQGRAPASGQPQVEELVVTGTRHPTPRSQTTGTVTVIDRLAIERSGARDALELLRDVAGFAIVQTGSRGGTTSLFARGGEADHNLVLIDGFQVNRGGGAFDLENLSTDGVERIEIVRGPLGALYGSDAMAAVIHVITRRGGDGQRASLSALAGSDHTRELGASWSGGGEGLRAAFAAGHYATSGLYTLNNGANNSSLRARLNWTPRDDLEVDWLSSYTDSAFDYPTEFARGVRGGAPPSDPHQGRKSQQWLGGLRASWRPAPGMEHRLSAGRNQDRTRYFDGIDPGEFASESKSTTREARSGAEYQMLLRSELPGGIENALTLGLEYERQEYAAGAKRTSPRGQRSRTSQREQRTTRAELAQSELSWRGRVFATLGARLDHNSAYGSVASPLAALAFAVPEAGSKLRAAWSRSFKEPTFFENFSSSSGALGNPDLEPERARSAELAFEQKWLGGALELSLAAFRTDYADLIAYVGSPAAGTALPSNFFNIQSARSQGLEAELRWQLSERIELGASYMRLRTRVRDAGGRADSAFDPGEELLRRPTHSGSFFVDFRGERLDLRLSGTVVGPRIDRDFGASFSGVRVRMDPYVKLDLSLGYLLHRGPQGRELRALLRLQNLRDLAGKRYEEVYGYKSPGFMLLGGLEVEL